MKSLKLEMTEQQAFENWVDKVRPSGDVSEVQYAWSQSSDYADFLSEMKEPDFITAERELQSASAEYWRTRREYFNERITEQEFRNAKARYDAAQLAYDKAAKDIV